MSKPKKQLTVSCDTCGKDTLKVDSTVYAAQKHNRKMFCSNVCRKAHFSKQVVCKCATCKKEFSRNKGAISETGNSFCSRSCAAVYNNVLYPKRGLVVTEESILVPKKNVGKNRNRHIRMFYCSGCRALIKQPNSTCGKCKMKATTEIALSYTIGQIKELYKDKTGMAVAAKIRGYGKTIYDRSNKPKLCMNCGYAKHYEVCHIKQVKDFPDTATMGEVHALDNLIALCPNCHWELDKGMLSIEDIRRRANTATC